MTISHTSIDDLEYYFSHFGKVTEINIKYDPMSCLTRGFCFVTFQSEDIVRQILRKPVHIIKGKIIELKRAKYRPICKKIFVGGLDPLITEQDIRTYFSQYGTVCIFCFVFSLRLIKRIFFSFFQR